MVRRIRKTRKLKRKATRSKSKGQRGGALNVRLRGNHAPNVNFSGSGLYTVIMWDPDAHAKSWLHWLVINAEEGDVRRGEVIMNYAPPSPPSGTHRYFIAMYSQAGPLRLEEKPAERGYFNVDNFVAENKLLKVGEFMFEVSA